MSTNSVQPDDAKVELTTDHVADDAPQWVSDAVNEADDLGDGTRGEHVPDVVTRCPHCGALQ